MEDWEDILSTRKWPDGSDVTTKIVQAKSVPNCGTKPRVTVSNENRNTVESAHDDSYGNVDMNTRMEYEDKSVKYLKRKRLDGIKSARLERVLQLDTAVASSSARSSRTYKKEFDTEKGIANITSRKTFTPLTKFRRAARIVLLLLKATASSRHASQGHQDQKSWSQIAEEQSTAKRTYDLFGISFDPSMFKAKREKYLSNEAKIIMSLYPADRTEDQLKLALLALNQAVDAFGEFPIKLQRSLASVGWYENFEAKRVIIRQGHTADNFYFILSGTAVVTLLETNKDTGEEGVRTVAFLRKGNSFGELALMHGAKRSATVTCQTNVELLAVSREDFIDIFMHTEKDKEPEHISFLRTIDVFRGWPVEKLPHNNPRICLFTFFRRGVLLCKDSNSTDWIYVIKTGTCRVLKDLFDTRPNIPGLEYVPYSLNQSFTKLPPIPHIKSTESTPRSHRHTSIQHNAHRHHLRLPDIYKRSSEQLLTAAIEHQAQLNAIFEKRHKVPRSDRYSEDLSQQENRNNPNHAGKVFVQIQKLASRDVFGLEQTVFGMIGQTTSCSLVSDGAECILINKKFFLQHLSDNVAKQIRKTIQPIPSEESLQQKLQDQTNWDAYKSMTVSNCVVFKKQLHEHEVDALYL
ncbi:cyclic nucleotide-binding domain-containing protein 2-like isoform X2 [Mercenaria mercenaria]|uniref:cyclic nucleotide-binding domain-containing protein 2-like isoform X2 n=1 Tax=Mercenaria mercenaria TaxID=6596 RepID=UPI00234F1876|nr:cyclic nucleotide-binding domain-containing protein 2-like isoform X2 [Mercenaria mercenaria]